jgi:PEP-CTERM motif
MGAIVIALGDAGAATVYQNTTNSAGGSFSFNGSTLIGSNLAANVDLNELTLTAGSAGKQITSFSFLAANFNTSPVVARPTIYVWAADGTGGDPGTLLGTFALPLDTFASGLQTTLDLAVPSTLIVPANMEIWAWIGFDNDNGASAITADELNNLGAFTFHPATIGADGPQALLSGPLNLGDNPTVFSFGGSFGANYGWTVSAAVPEPSTWALILAGFGGLGLAAHRASRKSRVVAA